MKLKKAIKKWNKKLNVIAGFRAGQRELTQDMDIETLFEAWFNNRMTVILMAIQCPRSKNPESAAKTRFFLEDIEHHYVDPHAPKAVRNAFRYLRRYFAVYPNACREHSEEATEMVERIYEALGLRLHSRGNDKEAPLQKKIQDAITKALQAVRDRIQEISSLNQACLS